MAELSTFGFYTVVRNQRQDWFGGYLVLNASGRPLEFHCTAPVRTNRAQEILFGATLEPYLYGEQIGQTLVNKAETAAAVICTDVPAALAVRQHIDLPVALVMPEVDAASDNNTPAEGRSFRVDASHGGSLKCFSVKQHRLALAYGFERDEGQVTASLTALADRVLLNEPFARIREAIEEAQRGGQ
ncbi:MAG TPA: hypothetical protein VHV77_18080 [Pirellulales bacterium]|jgi:hypothetical protein|nr:hypothetical protein [Pirellulales bacterium]